MPPKFCQYQFSLLVYHPYINYLRNYIGAKKIKAATGLMPAGASQYRERIEKLCRFLKPVSVQCLMQGFNGQLDAVVFLHRDLL